MNCHSVRNVLDLHREGRLSPRRARAVAAHLAGCAACRALAAPVESAPGAKAPDALKARLRLDARKISAAASAPGPEGHGSAAGLPLWPRETAGIALAAAALALVAGLIAATGAPSQAPRAGVAAVEEP